MEARTEVELKIAEKKGFFKKDETVVVRNACFKVVALGKSQMTLKLLREETRIHRGLQAIGVKETAEESAAKLLRLALEAFIASQANTKTRTKTVEMALLCAREAIDRKSVV